MARYIDADKLFPWLDVKYRSKYPIGDGEQYGTVLIYEVLDEIDDAETEDVAPVVHAHWEMFRDENNCTYGNYACTNCHTIQGLMKYRYCPYCGAKMDEEVD